MAARICLASALLALALLSGSVDCTWKTDYFFTSCTGLQFALPNLSYAKVSMAGSITAPCDYMGNNAWTLPINWYYYALYPPLGGCAVPPAGNECCHSISASSIRFTLSEYVSTSAVMIQTSTGTVTSGPFLGLPATLVTTKTIDLLKCLNQTGPGMEASSGTVVLTVVGGPICTGVIISESCPGLHSSL